MNHIHITHTPDTVCLHVTRKEVWTQWHIYFHITYQIGKLEYCILPITDYTLHIRHYILHIILNIKYYILHVTCYILHITCDIWHMTYDIWHMTCYTLHITHYTLHMHLRAQATRRNMSLGTQHTWHIHSIHTWHIHVIHTWHIHLIWHTTHPISHLILRIYVLTHSACTWERK